jgi:hypothetical protein
LNVGRRERKLNLPNLNSLKVELDTVHSCTGYVSLDVSYIDNAGNNVSTTDHEFCGLDNSAVIIENVRPCHSSWLETGNCDNLLEECKDYNVVSNVIVNSERIRKQLTIRENQKGQEIVEDNSGKIHFLSCLDRDKQHKHGNEMLVNESLVQDDSQKSEDTKALNNFLQHTNDSNQIRTLQSSLTTSPLKPLNIEEPIDCIQRNLLTTIETNVEFKARLWKV